MERLVKEYIDMLNGTGNATDKFWELEERIRKDKKHPGVMIELKQIRLNLLWNAEEAVFSITNGASRMEFMQELFTTG